MPASLDAALKSAKDVPVDIDPIFDLEAGHAIE